MVEVVALFDEGVEGRWRGPFDLVGLLVVGLVLAWLGLVLGRAV